FSRDWSSDVCSSDLGIMNVFGVFVLTAFVANAVIRDDETGFAPIIRSTRVTKLDYLVGRFFGAWLVSFILMTSVPVAVLLGSLMPWLDSEKIGPFVANHYLYALFVYTAPTLFVAEIGRATSELQSEKLVCRLLLEKKK